MGEGQNSLVQNLTVFINHDDMVGTRTDKNVFGLFGVTSRNKDKTQFVFDRTKELLKPLCVEHFCCAILSLEN